MKYALEVTRRKAFTLILALLLLVAGCGSASDETTPDPIDPISQSEAPSDPAKKETSFVISIPYESKVQDFPDSLKDYRLLKESLRGKMRVFQSEGEDIYFDVFPELNRYTGKMSCEPYYWMVRWRSNNPDVTLFVGTSSRDYEAAEEIFWHEGPFEGGAGFVEGYSCVAPYIAFGSALNGSGANLVDVNYEIRIWEHFPEI